jgi:hypothetical protein
MSTQQIHQLPEAPLGWFISGDSPTEYEIGTDRAMAHGGQASGYLKSRVANPSGFATLMQMFHAPPYQGTRVRLEAYVKTVDVTDWAGVWMRVDGPDGEILSFDNMDNRPITGTVDWTPYVVVLDVPEESVYIAFGIVLEGTGHVWMDDVSLEVVSQDVPLTAMDLGEQEERLSYHRDYPPQLQNLDFEA